MNIQAREKHSECALRILCTEASSKGTPVSIPCQHMGDKASQLEAVKSSAK